MAMNRWKLRLLLLAVATAIPFIAAYVMTPTLTPLHPGQGGPSPTLSRKSTKLWDQKLSVEDQGGGKSQSTSSSSSSSSPNQENSLERIPPKEKQSPQLDILFQQQNYDPFRADFRDSSEPQLMTTFGGGTALMFEMIAKKMLDWGNEAKPYSSENDPTSPRPTNNNNNNNNNSNNNRQQRPVSDATVETLPRWHPHSGIVKVNPNFRYEAPVMNNQGFASSIWRNVRKRNKPSLWRNALRTYDRMALLEQNPDYFNIQRSNAHHEGAMVACGKLGLWQRALELYHYVYQVEQDNQAEKFDQTSKQPLSSTKIRARMSSQSVVADVRRSRIRRTVKVTDTMISAFVHACVVASRQRNRNKGGGTPRLSQAQEEQEAALRRIPLDTALEILTTMKETHDIPLAARHINPLAAAYQSLGYVAVATDILQTMLSNRTAGEEPDDGSDILNVFDLCAKDKGSYSLLVQGAVVTGDWGAAVDALSDMTEAGLYPKGRHCNLWSEISERRTRPRAVGSRKKKRDDLWAESVP